MTKRRLHRRGAVLGVAAALVLTAGQLAASAAPGEPIDDPIPGHIRDGAIQLELQTVSEGLTAPNWGTWAPGVPGVLFVVDQNGPLWAVDTTTGAKEVVLNTADLLVPLILDADERGFLGAAFHPLFATNGQLYTMTSEPIEGTASTPDQQPNHWATLREWTVTNPTANPLEEPWTVVGGDIQFRALEPQFNHNGGALFFRPNDPRLYLTLGDGGCADDQFGQLGLAGEGPCISHEGPGNAQRLDNPHGKILRLDPLTAPPMIWAAPGNPMPEIYAYGFRNPFRASADRATGEIWTADVG